MEKSFIDYFKDTEDLIGNFVKKIKEDGKKVVLYGTGHCLSVFIDLVKDNGIEVLSLCDSDMKKCGKYTYGMQIIDWNSLQNCGEPFNVVVSTSHYEEIEQQLRKKGFLGEIFYLPKEAYYKNVLYGKSFLERHASEFQKTFDLLADDVSKQVFINVIKHNISLNNNYYREIEDLEIQGYFGTELYSRKNDEVIIDGGAFNGDTYREFLSDTSRSFKEYIAYEPDESNYKFLEKIDDKNLTVIKKGLGERQEKLRFSSGMGVSSSISEEGNLIVEVDAIDNLRPRRNVTFIKMDIEGAEKSAILGGKEVISADKPTMAISAYHRKEDMYDLVNTIREINSDYKIYFRHTFYYQKEAIQPDVIIYAVQGE